MFNSSSLVSATSNRLLTLSLDSVALASVPDGSGLRESEGRAASAGFNPRCFNRGADLFGDFHRTGNLLTIIGESL